MKRIIFCSVVLLVGNAVLAQTTPTAPAAPSLAQALTPMGTAPSTANMGHAIQNGTDNKVSVTQVGTSQGSFVEQGNGTGTGGNQARIWQTGNVGPNSGVANMAETHQMGTKNQTTQYQFGDQNEVLVNQGMLLTHSKRNRAVVQQGSQSSQKGEKNKAQIDQDGNRNQARTRQHFDENEASTFQYGNKNYADILQNGRPDSPSSHGHRAEIGQDGNLNDAWIRQKGQGATNEATARQVGDNNYSWQKQNATASSGMGNNAVVAQGTNAPNTMAANIDDLLDMMYPYRLGSGSSATNNEAFQKQNGDDNLVASYQMGDANYSEQEQKGDGNQALVSQNYYDSDPAHGQNYAKQVQLGNDNLAGIGQNGSKNRAFHSQVGVGNKALSVQLGFKNDVNIYQRDDLNVALTAQHGACNDILIVQYAGQSALVKQIGNNNTANIYQAGPDGGDGPYDCGFDPRLNQRPRNPIDIFNIPDICPGC